MSHIPIMAQYLEAGMDTSFGGVVEDVQDLESEIRVDFSLSRPTSYTPEHPVYIWIDLEDV